MHSFKPNNSTQTTLSKYFKKFEDTDNVKIQWTILHSTYYDVPHKPENFSIYKLEILAIAEADWNKTLNTRNELATICPHHKSNCFWILILIFNLYRIYNPHFYCLLSTLLIFIFVGNSYVYVFIHFRALIFYLLFFIYCLTNLLVKYQNYQIPLYSNFLLTSDDYLSILM